MKEYIYYTVRDSDGDLYLNTVLCNCPEDVLDELQDALTNFLTKFELEAEYKIVKLKITEVTE